MWWKEIFGCFPVAPIRPRIDLSDGIEISLRWPAYAVQIAMKLNKIHADQRRMELRLMAESDDLKLAMDFLKTEVSEAVAKFMDVSAKLEAALANDADFDALKAEVKGAATEIKTIAEGMDTAFGTQFDPSQN